MFLKYQLNRSRCAITRPTGRATDRKQKVRSRQATAARTLLLSFTWTCTSLVKECGMMIDWNVVCLESDSPSPAIEELFSAFITPNYSFYTKSAGKSQQRGNTFLPVRNYSVKDPCPVTIACYIYWENSMLEKSEIVINNDAILLHLVNIKLCSKVLFDGSWSYYILNCNFLAVLYLIQAQSKAIYIMNVSDAVLNVILFCFRKLVLKMVNLDMNIIFSQF